jgi:hypothetical protein
MDLVNERPQEFYVPVTDAAMYWDNNTAIDIAYNHKIGNSSKHINVAYHLVPENVQSG